MKKLSFGEWVSVVISIIVIAVFFNLGGAFGINFGGKNEAATASSNATTTAENSLPANVSNNVENILQINDVVIGTGAIAEPGKKVTVNYVGTLLDGTKFDSSIDRGTPFSFNLGAGQVIRGWEQGIQGMKVGGERKLVIPPAMAYGNQAIGSIPANSTLQFDVTLLKVE
jgi:peptidylprolyl isomerase